MTIAVGLTFGGIITIALIVALLILVAGALWRRRRLKRLRAKQQAVLLKAVERSVRPSRWPWGKVG
jgi:MYXO-CTERM domain-containing protein